MILKNIRKVYHNKRNTKEALKGINLDLSEKGLIVLLGSSGCGKTTLLNIMSGKDKVYEGEITEVGEIEYLTQEFNLLESLRVIDNLLMVKEDNQEIEKLLKQFDLWEHRNKKVKKCSNGQKKRIQFIRALLHKPGMLLCDEPTAALDHENSVLMMNYLKEISKDIQVVIVTHHIALAEKYADRIIQMDQGCIIRDEKQNNNRFNNVEEGESLSPKENKATLTLVIKELFSRIGETSFLIGLVSLAMMAIFVTFNLYSTIEGQTDYKNAFKYGENLILSYPKDDTVYVEHVYDDGAVSLRVNFDIYDYDDIVKVIENNPEIIATEAFYDNDVYKYGKAVRREISENESKTFKNHGSQTLYHYDKPYNQIYLLSNDEITEVDNLINQFFVAEDVTERNDIFDQILYAGYSHENKALSIFELSGHEQLPMVIGTTPQKEDEVMLAINTADYFLEKLHLDSYEQLIGKEIVLVSRGYMSTPYIDHELLNEELILHRNQVKVSGIAAVENKFMNYVFFQTPFAENPIMKKYVKNYEDLKFEYVRFLVKPGIDYEVFAEKINQQLIPDKSSFIQFAGKGINSEMLYYRNPKNFLKYSILITVVFLSLILVFNLFISNRNKKEHQIIKTYRYSLIKERGLRIFLVHFVSFLIVLMMSKFLCDQVNQLASYFEYERFMTFSIYNIFVAAFAIFALSWLFEVICEVRRK